MTGTSETASTDPWFKQWFGEDYLHLYPHRNLEEARDGVSLLRRTVPSSAGAKVLDLACGAGRHLGELRSAGLDAIGLDLSMTLLRSAKMDQADSPLVRGDMRVLPFADGVFGLVTNFFTSFGYFDDVQEDRFVLREIRRVLAGGGYFFMDFLNAPWVKKNLQERDEGEINGAWVVQTRRLLDGGRVVEKTIEIEGRGSEPRIFTERVRLYSPDELVALLEETGLVVENHFGDYSGAALAEDAPRCIVAGRASLT